MKLIKPIVVIFIFFIVVSCVPRSLSVAQKNACMAPSANFKALDAIHSTKIHAILWAKKYAKQASSKELSLSESSERLIASVKIAKENPKSLIYHLGGNGFLKKNDINENEVAKLFYKNVGFNLNRVNFINNSRNTIENFNTLKKDNLIGKSNILVTSAFHMKRSIMISRKLNMNFIPYAVDFRSVNHSSFRNYYQSFSVAENWSSINIFFREIIGIIAFKLFY